MHHKTLKSPNKIINSRNKINKFKQNSPKPIKKSLKFNTFTTKINSSKKPTKNSSNKTTVLRASTKTSTKTKNSKNKKTTNSSLKSNSIKKNSNSCPSNTTKSKQSLKNSKKSSYHIKFTLLNYPTKKFNSTNKTSKLSISKNPPQILNKSTNWSGNSKTKIDNSSTNLTPSKVILFNQVKNYLKTIQETRSSKIKDNLCLWVSNMKSSEVNWLSWWKTGKDSPTNLNNKYQLKKWSICARLCSIKMELSSKP